MEFEYPIVTTKHLLIKEHKKLLETNKDILNLDHGEGGKMMFNFADKEYSWDDFIEDKQYMFDKN